MTAPLPYSPEEIETLRNGSQYQTRQNARWLATLEQHRAAQPCGHPAAVANRSVETGVAFCDMCRLNEMLNDALTMETKHKAERDALAASLAHAAGVTVEQAKATHEKTAIDLRLARAALRAELETERMRLVACSVVSKANTPESAARQRQMHADYRSPACDDVATAVDREMALRAQVEAARAACARVLSAPSAVRQGAAVDILAAMDGAKP